MGKHEEKPNKQEQDLAVAGEASDNRTAKYSVVHGLVHAAISFRGDGMEQMVSVVTGEN